MNLIKRKINLGFLVEGRGVKTYCGKLLLRSFPEKLKRPGSRVSPAAGTGTPLGSERF